MTDKAARDLITRLIDGIDRGDTSVMDEVFHDDAVMEWPASRERVVGAVNRRAVYANMPALPRVTNRHLFGTGDLMGGRGDPHLWGQALRGCSHIPAARRQDREGDGLLGRAI